MEIFLEMNEIKNFRPNVKGMGSFILLYKNSTNIETPGYFGISHLIEHCMCEQLKSYELEFEKYGVNYNATTNLTYVEFYLKGLDDGIIKFRNKFYDLIVNYEITKDVFERERNIVIQEYHDCFLNPQSLFFINVYKKYFNTRSPIGELENLQNLTYEKFIDYKNKYFSYPTSICNTSSKKIKKSEFKTIKNKNLNVIDLSGLSFKESTGIPLIEEKVSDSSRLLLFVSKFKYNEETLEEYIYYSSLAENLCYGLSSPLYQDLREGTGHVYGISAGVVSLLEKGNAFFYIYVQTEPIYEEEIRQKLIESLKKHLYNLNEDTFNDLLIGMKNAYKKKDLLSYSNADTFSHMVFDKTKNFEFNFEKFKKYAEKIFDNEFILINNIDY